MEYPSRTECGLKIDLGFIFFWDFNLNKKIHLDSEIRLELEHALASRQIGNEGKARVCARRAAGMAVKQFFQRNSTEIQKDSAYELILAFSNLPGLPSIIKKSASNLTKRVSKSFELPEGVDLIEDAERLCDYLSGLN